MDDDFQRRLDQILLDIKGLEDLITDIQSPKKTSEKDVNEKIKVRPLHLTCDKGSVLLSVT